MVKTTYSQIWQPAHEPADNTTLKNLESDIFCFVKVLFYKILQILVEG